MNIVDKTLAIIRDCIDGKTYKSVETERLELKNLAAGWGSDWQRTVCAFLNTKGGIIIIGIQDKNNVKPPHYRFTGYEPSEKNEAYLTRELPTTLFTDERSTKQDLSAYFNVEIKDFMEGKVAVVYVDELPDDLKYVYFGGGAYKRKITGDYALSKIEIQTFEEIKQELIANQELSLVENVGISVLNIDKLNDFIQYLNRGKGSAKEKLKTDIENAMPFLVRKCFARDNTPTLLGMLVCGDHVEDYIAGKAEIHCYLKSQTKGKLTDDKKPLQDNVNALVESASEFVTRYAKLGITYEKGGTADFEYPQDLIRETINNAIAHRSYQIPRPIILEVTPSTSVMIQNPGSFGRRQRIYIDTALGKIRRILPIQIAKNPKLTHLLYSFDRWEGRGNGLASIINACLENVIDVPYYILADGEIKFFIRTGKVLDAAMKAWLKSYQRYLLQKNGGELTEDEQIVLSFFYKSEKLNNLEYYTVLLTIDNNHMDIIAHLERKKLLFKNPESPELYPIYMVDRTLLKNDFTDELSEIFGTKHFEILKPDYKNVLNFLYWYNQYGEIQEKMSANNVGTLLYEIENAKNTGKNKDSKEEWRKIENFKRKIRLIFEKLEDKGYINRDTNNKAFVINKNFKSSPTLFDDIQI